MLSDSTKTKMKQLIILYREPEKYSSAPTQLYMGLCCGKKTCHLPETLRIQGQFSSGPVVLNLLPKQAR